MSYTIFHRFQIEEWQAILKNIGFWLFFAVFSLMLLRVFFMSGTKVRKDAALPLEDEIVKETHANSK